MQELALIISVTLIALLALVFLFFVRSSSAAGGENTLPSNTEKFRTLLIAGFILLIGIVTVSTLNPWPHAAEAGSSPSQLTVKVNGAQWYWDVSHEELPVNTPIVFEVTSQDVNHGFGIYAPDGRLLTQTQAMPGYINKLYFTFPKTGTFKVLCLEFCGTAHHDMTHEFKIVEKSAFKPEEQ